MAEESKRKQMVKWWVPIRSEGVAPIAESRLLPGKTSRVLAFLPSHALSVWVPNTRNPTRLFICFLVFKNSSCYRNAYRSKPCKKH
ncbi:hypothetical protein Dda3937_00942 [Dickeya dadantii 3937]|uniref:Uncharacterized protein n=1 Tax=Dickeya dadantii (strain 3937) TaxID=198628 RepID=E0SCT7_DICD3|nr:hypothetical protein Dda3937_00942 [Dickeya dadantii 3937]